MSTAADKKRQRRVHELVPSASHFCQFYLASNWVLTSSVNG
jgi:hypothetical protein